MTKISSETNNVIIYRILYVDGGVTVCFQNKHKFKLELRQDYPIIISLLLLIL